MYFVEGPNGEFVPLEGQELQSAQEYAWEHSPMDFADAYMDYTLVNRVELVKFAYYLSSLIWLQRTVSKATDAIDARYIELRASGAHRIAGWEGESELVLNEEIGLLRNVNVISRGSIVAAAAAALETLITDLLDRDDGSRLRMRGLKQKFAALIRRWPDLAGAEAMQEDLDWIVERRNSFAHSLLDEAGPSWRERKQISFDEDMVEDTFVRVGRIAESLAIAWEEHGEASGR